MNDNTVNVVGYTRVSTENQVKGGYSLEEQRAEIEKYCIVNNYSLVKIWSDEGVSGADANEEQMTLEREGLLDMLASLKDNDIRYIVVLSTNRLWRNDFVKVLIRREIKRNNVDIKAIDRPNYSIYAENPNDIFVNSILEGLDQYERSEIALKLKRGRTQKAKGGGYAGGGVPFGYCCPHGGKRLSIQPEEAEAVQMVFQINTLMPQQLTLQKVSELMNYLGYKGRGGRDFNPMLVKRILDRECFYRGKYVYGGIESEGDYEPILQDNVQGRQ